MKYSTGVNKNPKKPLRMTWGKTLAPIVSIVGRSNSGKTTLLEKLITALKQRGFCVGTIKHDIHGFEMDQPGKDSWRHKKAGASTTIISSPYQIGMVMDVDQDHKPEELMPLLSNMDIILTEGYKSSENPKLEVFRPDVHKDPICKGDKNLLALICDEEIDLGVPCFANDDIERITEFIIKHFHLQHPFSTECKQVAS